MNSNKKEADAAPGESRDPSPSVAPKAGGAGASRSDVFVILRLLVPLSVCALLATVLGRALGPSWAGLAVGMNRLVRVMELVGSASTQFFAMAVTVVALGSVVSMTRAQASWALRIWAIVAGGFAILVGVSAAALPMPRLSLGVSAAFVTVLALACAWDARKAHFARPAAFVLGATGLASLFRLVAVFVTAYAASANPPRPSALLLTVARGAATASFALEVIVAFGVAIIIAQGSRKLANPMTTVALVLAFLCTRQASLGHLEDAGPVSILLHRAADRFLSLPEPFLPPAARMFLVFFSLVMAVCVLFAKRQVPALAGAMSILLLARSSSDMPLGALSLVVASIGVALASRDQRGLWSAIENEEAKEARKDGQTWVRPPEAPKEREAHERSAEVSLPQAAQGKDVSDREKSSKSEDDGQGGPA